ncbi:Lysogenization protein HflD [Lysobacter dokdonensis DS-58]|uniref:High frequency lysogenization protein HflD homolog n=1 Tax=Lysobacter dokdonensis DS-58 TaxID=1300345 RepID=A0A0A2WLB4_9GAMM|nr:high frequency lysogenization protein HflD [Lysobacter dokdonensis]KGQ19055.1 Lysogenization protein HflD [Lysobacter dokdonensis DS-58]
MSANPTPSNTIEERVLALAGLAQALRQVRQIAETGQADTAVLQTATDSVFRLDADTPVEVYGDERSLAPGMQLLLDYFTSATDGRDELLPRLAFSVLQLERRFVREGATAQKVQEGIVAIAPDATRLGSTHPDVLGALGTLYADTVSHLRPRVMVQGNPHYLGQAAIVSEIRAVLLAALRSAVLWRQLGGSFWDFVIRRRAMVAAVQSHLRL